MTRPKAGAAARPAPTPHEEPHEAHKLPSISEAAWRFHRTHPFHKRGTRAERNEIFTGWMNLIARRYRTRLNEHLRSIGQAAARKAHHGLGMRILYNSRRRAAPEVEAETGAGFCASLDDLLAEADFVSLHMPGGAETRHLIDERRLSLMRPSALLINTARGPVIDEAALARALAGRRIAGAGLDVYEREPQVDPALLGLENVVLLPHLGSGTVETRTAMGMRVADNLDAFFGGAEPPDRLV